MTEFREGVTLLLICLGAIAGPALLGALFIWAAQHPEGW